MARQYTKRQITDADEMDLGQTGPATMSTTGDAEIENPQIEAITDLQRFNKDKLALLAFMEEPVTVHIHETSEEQADSNFSIWVNGRQEVFFRGQEKTVKRKFVEGLARAKPTTYRNEQFKMQDGSDSVRYPKSRGLRYSFSVVHDNNPRGRDWLKEVLRQP